MLLGRGDLGREEETMGREPGKRWVGVPAAGYMQIDEKNCYGAIVGPMTQSGTRQDAATAYDM